MNKTLVIGLGSPILGDDGVGWRVAEEVQRVLAHQQSAVEVDCWALGGLSLMERLVGYDRAILIDAIASDKPTGSLTSCPLEELPDWYGVHTRSTHDATLQAALQLGRQLKAQLPEKVWIVGVNAEQLYDFSECLSPPVAAAVPQAVEAVLKTLTAFSEEDSDGLA